MLKVIAVAVAIAATTTVAGAQGTTTYKTTAKPATQASTTKTATHRSRRRRGRDPGRAQAQAKISEETARATALAKVPNGSVKSNELEKEHGKLIYSYDITVPGKSGVEQVNVDAVTGKVIAKVHESAKTEKKEAEKEKTAAKK
jgi:uncharacterized membrane protein YkoI